MWIAVSSNTTISTKVQSFICKHIPSLTNQYWGRNCTARYTGFCGKSYRGKEKIYKSLTRFILIVFFYIDIIVNLSQLYHIPEHECTGVFFLSWDGFLHIYASDQGGIVTLLQWGETTTEGALWYFFHCSSSHFKHISNNWLFLLFYLVFSTCLNIIFSSVCPLFSECNHVVFLQLIIVFCVINILQNQYYQLSQPFIFCQWWN